MLFRKDEWILRTIMGDMIVHDKVCLDAASTCNLSCDESITLLMRLLGKDL